MKSTYLVYDPLGVYQAVGVEGVGEDAVRALAVETMYGCPLSEVDSAHVQSMLENVVIVRLAR